MAHHLLLLTTSLWMVFVGAIPEEYYLEDYLYDNYYDSDYDYSGLTGPAARSVPSSLLSHHEALLGQLVEAKSKQNQPISQQVQSHVKGKLIPEPGWIPLTDTPVGKPSNPAITFLQGAVTPAHTRLIHHSPVLLQPPVFRTRPSENHGFEQQKPTHKPIIVINHTPRSKFEQLITVPPTRDPITINPKQDTIVIQYNTVTGNKKSIREERETQPLAFDERIELLPIDCKEEVKTLIKDILEAPLRKRNSLLGMLRMKEDINNSRTKENRPRRPRPIKKPIRQQEAAPRQPPPLTQEQPRRNQRPHDVVSQTFSNFPAFQKPEDDRQPKLFRPNNPPPTTIRPQPAITLEPMTLPPLTQPPPTPQPETFPPRRFVPQQIFSEEDNSEENTSQETNRPGLSIEQFLKRYPEVRRVSSRFGDGTASQERVVGNLLVKKNEREERKNKPKRRRKNKNRNKRPPPTTTTFPPFTTTPRPPPTTTRPPPTTTTTRRPRTTRPPPPTTTRRPPPTTTRRPPPTTTHRPPTPTTRQPLPPPAQVNNNQPSDYNYDYNDYSDELSSDDYSYLYYEEYYEELVPEHHRFHALEQRTTTTTTTTPPPPVQRKPKSQRRKKKKKKQRPPQTQQSNSFSFFSSQPSDFASNEAPRSGDGFPNFPNSIVTTEQPKPTFHTAAPKQPPVAIEGNGLKAGPFGYIDKGTFFEDSNIPGFPEMIEVIYQGFVWAFDIRYGKEGGRVMHGGIHDILKDKVKRDKVFLEDDYIVRVTGRASPYNINRLTFYTAKGQVVGPWGDRRSKESVDFDVSAPPGHGLAYFSGTVDFGVPLRSVSFHWRPLPA